MVSKVIGKLLVTHLRLQPTHLLSFRPIFQPSTLGHFPSMNGATVLLMLKSEIEVCHPCFLFPMSPHD